MAQSGSATSQSFASTVATDKLVVPVGENLDSSTLRTKTPSPGALAYDALTSRLYYGDESVWILLDNSEGDGDVIGPNSSVSGHVAGFTGTDGKHIYDMGVTLSGSNTGDVTLTAFGSAPNANGASLSGQALTLEPASASFPGGVSTTSQTLAGVKTFNDGIIFGGIGSSILNQYRIETASLGIYHGTDLLQTSNFTFMRTGNLVTVLMPQFTTVIANFTGNAQTSVQTVPSSFIPSSTSIVAYGNMTTVYSQRPSAGASGGWIGYLRVIFSGGIWQLFINPDYDNNAASYMNFGNAGTGINNGWMPQSVSYLLS